MHTKGQNYIGFICAVLLIAVLLFCAVFGVGNSGGVFDSGNIVLGLDLVGGSRIVYEADITTEGESRTESLEDVRQMLRARLDLLGYTEATATLESATGRVVVEIPSVSNPEEAVQLLGASAVLTFVDADGNVVLNGSDIASASANYGSLDSSGVLQHYISLQLTKDAVGKFADATEAASKRTDGGNYISILLDGNEINKPGVHERIESEYCTISGNYTAETAAYIAGIISAGSLPFTLHEVQLDSVGATLGERALSTSLLSGGIGILLVMLFMLLIYRLPGLIAAVSLTAYCALMGILLCLFHVNLSLPGIAGIILSVGMAVDANVVVFERIKEELRGGRSTLAAFRAGFSSARVAIFDSNITSILAALVLLIFGSGTVKGFAVTLLIGVLLSMFTAMFITRYLLARLVGMGVTNVWLWGLRKKEYIPAADRTEPILPAYRLSFIGMRRKLLYACGAVLLCGILCFAVRGFALDVDFAGGTAMQVDMKDYLEANGETTISDALETDLVAFIEAAAGTKVSSFQRAGDTQFLVKTAVLSTTARDALYTAIAETYHLTDGYVYCSNVDSSISGEFRRSAVLSSLIAVILMLLYITLRFDLSSGISAVICLCHDLFWMLLAYSALAIPLSGTMIAALLTILGYSINATIIVFDRVRDNKKNLPPDTPFAVIVEKSIHDTLFRSLNTTATTFVTVLMLCLFGVDSIRSFAIPLAVGIIAGLLSSVALAGNLWCFLRNRLPAKKSVGSTDSDTIEA